MSSKTQLYINKQDEKIRPILTKVAALQRAEIKEAFLYEVFLFTEENLTEKAGKIRNTQTALKALSDRLKSIDV